MSQRHKPHLNTPQQKPSQPHLRTPADVYYSTAWRLLLAVGGIVGLRWIQQQRWGRLLLGAALSRQIWRYAHHHEPSRPSLRQIRITDHRIPPGFDGFRIGQISDIHLGQPYSHNNLRWAIAQMQQHQPDMIVLTGDMVNNRESIGTLPHYLRQLRAPYGVYAIPGNHDYVEEIDDVMQALTFAGVPLMRNQGFVVHLHGDALYVAGVDDIWHGQMRLDTAMASNTSKLPTLLLAHSPDTVFEALDYPHIVLQLSGHVHGGHIRLPVLGPLARPRYGRHFTHGTYTVEHIRLHVSLGLSGRQLRLGNAPEVGIITLAHHNGGD
ncbi:MAG: metallophosphoesterase [Chloroflexota bacterium]|jgi:predicted MPP superfamily phosphohydrolase